MYLCMPTKGVFDEAQNEALRVALKAYVEEHRVTSQAAVGKLLGVTQQTASAFLSGSSGLSYPAASRVAILAGERGVDDFFEARGVLPWRPPPVAGTDTYPNRAHAMQLARALRLPQEAVDAVRTMAGKGLEQRSSSWWVTQVQTFADELGQQRKAADDQRHAVEERSRRKRPKPSTAA